MEKHLKTHQYYSDLYDRHTVETLRQTERIANTKDPTDFADEEITKEQAASVRNYVKTLMLHFQTGDRYINKAKTIQEWMDKDKEKDELYENAQAPEDIRCLTCRSRLSPSSKELWSTQDKPDRVLFMYDCPNNCLPHRAFFSDGEEWRTKLNLCLKCNTPLQSKSTDTGEKLITTHTCSSCGFTETDEYEWTHKGKDEFDENFAKDRDRFCLTDEEGSKYQAEKWNLEQVGKVLKEWEEKEKLLAEKLKLNPKGFHLEGAGYCCSICGDHTPEGDNWYDEYGIKCLICQKAIDLGEIPAFLAKDKDSWYSKYDIESAFNVKSPTLRKWVRKGIIKQRTVSHFGEGVHCQLFLLEDNKKFLPPKDMVKSRSVTEKKDGEDWHSSRPWYNFVDPHEHLKGYKIMDYLRVAPSEEMKARREEEKKKWEEKRARRRLKSI